MKTTNFSLTEAIAVTIEQKLALLGKRLLKVEEKSGGDSVLARIEVGRTTQHHNKGEIYRAELTLEIPGEPNLRAVATEEDLHRAIDVVKEEVERELRRSHEKRRDQARRGARELKRRIRDDAA